VRKACRFAIVMVILAACSSAFLWFPSIASDAKEATTNVLESQPLSNAKVQHALASGTGTAVDARPYVVIELPNSSIPARAAEWSRFLNNSGVVSHVSTVDEILVHNAIIENAPVVILDASTGADNGTLLPDLFIQALIAYDSCLILTGRAAWILHRLKGTSEPHLMAPVSQHLLVTSDYESAVFMRSPVPLNVSARLTGEPITLVPVDAVQGEQSRIVELTGRESPTHLAALRHDSYPLDVFLYGPENPTELTDQGRGLFVNIVAYASSLRESSTAQTIGSLQVPEYRQFAGGLRYLHEPTMKAAYYVAQAARSAVNESRWHEWQSQHSVLIDRLLDSLYVDYGTEAGFASSVSEGAVSIQSTAQGLWLVSIMDLATAYNMTELASYLSTRQDPAGGFGNHITTTHLALEALASSGHVGNINLNSLESWLRDCVIDATDTSDPDLWGAVAEKPDSTAARNSYATQYVLSLQTIGKGHHDPLKLTSWILTRTSNVDGSYDETLTGAGELVTGTASALTTMAVMSTLDPGHRAAGLAWLAANQLESGGFSLTVAASDSVAKSSPTSCAARCLDALGEQSGAMAAGILSYVGLTETPLGFEAMEPIPSLTWSYWLSVASRMSHAQGAVDYGLAREYADSLVGWLQYPSSVTAVTALEYGPTQYRMQSVWTQYFGVAMSSALGAQLTSGVVSSTVSYLAQSQSSTGHFRATTAAGTAHMQHTVAAVEALYLLGSLDVIPYRANLKSAVLASYTSGYWSTTGWTLRPFAGQQSAIDWLSTRAAIRLGILNSEMAQKLAATIETRIQYKNLWALSRDVATLALLNTSGFSVNLDSVNADMILDALGTPSLPLGWVNSTELWQPVYTAGVLEMVSTLGLRTRLWTSSANMIEATGSGTVDAGRSLNLDISIVSQSGTHGVLTLAFGKWWLFENVANDDSIIVPVPDDEQALGQWNLSVILCDFGSSRGFDSVPVNVSGVLQGNVTLETAAVLAGQLLNGTVDWALDTGRPVGQSQITLRLGDPPDYEQWEYVSESPFMFSIPTSGITTRTHNLTVTVSKLYCLDFVLQDHVTIYEPVPTRLSTPALVTGNVSEVISIDWTLQCAVNNTDIEHQQVTVIVLNAAGEAVHQTTTSSNPLYWNPPQRGNFTYSLLFRGNGSLVGSESNGSIRVYENTLLEWIGPVVQDQYSSLRIAVRLSTATGVPLSGHPVHVTVMAPSLHIVTDTVLTTNLTGHVCVTIMLVENGAYMLDAEFHTSQMLLQSFAREGLMSWSQSSIAVGGISHESLVGNTWILWARVTDSKAMPVTNRQVTLTLTYVPYTVILQETLYTNSTGHVSLRWSGSTAGSYVFAARCDSTPSRGFAASSFDFELRVPLTLTISTSGSLQVTETGWVEVVVSDYLGRSVSGLILRVTVRNHWGGLDLETSGVTVAGAMWILWTPVTRGSNTIMAACARQDWYESAESTIGVAVVELPKLEVELPFEREAPDVLLVTIEANGRNQSALGGVTVMVVASMDGEPILVTTNTTSVDGILAIRLVVSRPGYLLINATLPAQEWLLQTSTMVDGTVLGRTMMDLMTPGQPVKQGSAVGIVVTLSNYAGNPISGAEVAVTLSAADSSVLVYSLRTTGSAGKCTLAYDFNFVGDFVINATFLGDGLNGRVSRSEPQRVYTIPNLVLQHPILSLAGEALSVNLSLFDSLGKHVPGRVLLFSVEQNGMVILEQQVQSDAIPVSVCLTPAVRGLITLKLLHPGDVYYYASSATGQVSVMEVASGRTTLIPEQVSLFSNVTLVYVLSSSGQVHGISVRFEVLGIDLVPVWSIETLTNGSGVAQTIYTASHAHGMMTVLVGPTPDEYLLGCDTQEQFTVTTECQVAVSLTPTPACSNRSANITIALNDQLGRPIDSVNVVVKLYDPYGQQVKLGAFSSSITVPVYDGIAAVPFKPNRAGLYTVEVSCSGSVSVRPFYDSSIHTVYTITRLDMTVKDRQLPVGGTLIVVALLLDDEGAPLPGRTLEMLLDGPGSSAVGPIQTQSNTTGYVTWSVTIEQLGAWNLEVRFAGIGVYLPTSTTTQIDVMLGTTLTVELMNPDDVVALRNPACFLLLLSDSQSTPMEGFSMKFEAYHQIGGLVSVGNVIQTGQGPVWLNLTLPRMGNFTVVVSFLGTRHYLPTGSAVALWVTGITGLSIECPDSIDRADNTSLALHVLDECESNLPIDILSPSVSLRGPEGVVNLTDRISINGSVLSISLRGLSVGRYSLDVSVPDSPLRLGCNASATLSVTAKTRLSVTGQSLPGIVGRQHFVEFTVIDSLGEVTTGLLAYVSLYAPDGREVYGSPLTNRTTITVVPGGIRVEWVPSQTGNYSLGLVVEGSTYFNRTAAAIVTLTRYETWIELNAPGLANCNDAVLLSITLTRQTGRISGTTVTVTLTMNGASESTQVVTTDNRGIALLTLEGLLAGNHTILAFYGGSQLLAPCTVTAKVVLTPVVSIRLREEPALYRGLDSSLTVIFTVIGVPMEWRGTLNITLLAPSNRTVDTWSFSITDHGQAEIGFEPAEEGTYWLDITLSGLPIIVSQTEPLAVLVRNPMMLIQMDAGTAYVAAGTGILSVLGLVVRRKLRSLMLIMPIDWEE